MIRVISGPKSWIEGEAIRQLEKTAELPGIVEAIGMPGLHPGQGCPVDAVFICKGRIYPHLIGTDIGCVDADTDYLSPTGWRKISEYDDSLVMQYDPDTGKGRFVQPEAFIKEPCAEFNWFKTKYGINQMLSDEHRILCWRNGKRIVISAAELSAEHARLKLGARVKFETTFQPDLDTELGLTEDQLRVQVMVFADGTLRNTHKADIHLRKERKILRCRMLLEQAGLEFQEWNNASGSTIIRFVPPMYTKRYEDFWRCSLRQLRIVADECLHWDGNHDEKCFYTRDKDSADFIHYVFTAVGKRAVLRADRHASDGETDYRVFAYDNTQIGIAGTPKTPVTRVPSSDGFKYCFRVPSGFWIMRRDGNVVMTGNCGMSLWGTSARPIKPERLAKRFKTSLERGIENPTEHLGDIAPCGFEHSLGTYGRGNHFGELQTPDEILDKETFDRVLGNHNSFLLIHSGSRGYGEQILYDHTARFQGNGLAADSAEAGEYIKAHDHAVAWARVNRRVLANRMLDALGANGTELFDAVHNFMHYQGRAQDGDPLWVHRKGAIPTEGYPLVVIPGSRGAHTYIVQPIGDQTISAHSVSHGAGRKMSRRDARVKFHHTMDSVAKLERTKFGSVVICEDRVLMMEEAPEAYKSIDRVVQDLVDHGLVKVIALMKPVVTYKMKRTSDEKVNLQERPLKR